MMKMSCFFVSAVLSSLLFVGSVSCAYGHTLVFGPEIFPGENDKSRRVVRDFSVKDTGQKFFISVQGNTGSDGQAGSAVIRINGRLVFSAHEFGHRNRMLSKSVKLQKKNRISVEAAGGAAAPVIVTIMSLEERTLAARVPPLGEAVELDGYARVIFPAGAFDAEQNVRVSVSASPSIQDIFQSNAAGPRLPYEIRIDAGDRPPKKDIEVSVKYPDSFFDSHFQIHVFARMPDAMGEPGMKDRFHLISSGLDDKVSMAMATLPKHAFSKRRNGKGGYEAVITIGLIH